MDVLYYLVDGVGNVNRLFVMNQVQYVKIISKTRRKAWDNNGNQHKDQLAFN